MSMQFKLTPDIAPKNIPLSDTAVLSPRTQPHLAIAKDGEILIVFPRGIPYAKIKKIADRMEAEIYKVDVKVSYEILGTNQYYDHSPTVSL